MAMADLELHGQVRGPVLGKGMPPDKELISG
jgi:hypothetical protein